jgi:hypothetical protein
MKLVLVVAQEVFLLQNGVAELHEIVNVELHLLGIVQTLQIVHDWLQGACDQHLVEKLG